MYSLVSSSSVRLALRFTGLRYVSSANLNISHNDSSKAAPSQPNLLSDKIQVPEIERLNSFKERQLGIPGLISNSTLQDLWFNQLNLKLEDFKDYISQSSHNDYSDCFSIDSLHNSDLTSTASSNKVINQYRNLLEKMSKKFDDNDALLFDLTASIYNLFYFFSSIKATSTNQMIKLNAQELLTFNPSFTTQPLDTNFVHLINKSFGSVEEFLTLFNDSANAIKGNGYTYLVYKHIENSRVFSKLGHLSILNVYNNGIPHTFTSNRISNGKEFEKKKNKINDFSSSSNSNNFIPSMDDAEALNYLDFTFIPLVSIGSNPSFYLRDYGVYGKKLYVNNAINSIDWDTVVSRIPTK